MAYYEVAPPLGVIRGHTNVGVVRDGDRALLIDCGAGDTVPAETVLLTHYHRDTAAGVHSLAASGARIVVPEGEERLFSDPGSYWNDPARRWHLYTFRPGHLVLTEPVSVDGVLRDGDVIEWGASRITALHTPGHTDGSLSYLVESDSLRAVFCGDLIYEGGRIWDLHSLQKGGLTSDYHGFLGSRRELMESLQRIKALAPDVVVPSHGGPITEPAAEIDALISRLRECYRKYVEISAARFYWPDLFGERAGDGPGMPFGEIVPVPDFLRHTGTSWIIVSRDGAAFVMDCGEQCVLEELRRVLASGEISSVEGLWVTHYHDDHVDSIPQFQREFDCPCYAEESVAQVVTSPVSWRLPCLSNAEVRVDHVLHDGESWRWREFGMTAYHFPGQSLHHGALLVECRGRRLLFVGDSFTPSGIDDYCPYNRNFLGPGVGYERCIELVRKLEPDAMFNPHRGIGFRFGPEQCRYMLDSLRERRELYGQILPWDDVNRGLDENWVHCFPYEQPADPGEVVRIEVVLTNHGRRPCEFSARPVPPRTWPAPSEWVTGVASARCEGRLHLSVAVPPDAAGRVVIPVDIRCDGMDLPRFTEVIVEVTGSPA